jgi:hypothetical protein
MNIIYLEGGASAPWILKYMSLQVPLELIEDWTNKLGTSPSLHFTCIPKLVWTWLKAYSSVDATEEITY